MAIHEVAGRGFHDVAEIYELSRPGYPPEVVDWLVENLGLGPGRRVLDLAAGTGKLTRLLPASGAQVVALEPVVGMREVLRRNLPVVPVVAAVAEALPFAAETFAAVTVAQAFHWFDRDTASAELARVLAPDGRLGLVWNVRDRSVDWTDRVWSIMDRVEKRAPWRNHEQKRAAVGSSLLGFGQIHEAVFWHTQQMTPAEILARISSVSHVAVLPPGRRAEIMDEVREVLATHPETRGRRHLTMRYRVDAYWCQRA